MVVTRSPIVLGAVCLIRKSRVLAFVGKQRKDWNICSPAARTAYVTASRRREDFPGGGRFESAQHAQHVVLRPEAPGKRSRP